MLLSKILECISDLFDSRTKQEKTEDEYTESLLIKACEKYEKDRIQTYEAVTKEGLIAFVRIHQLPSKLHSKHLRLQWNQRLYCRIIPKPHILFTPPPPLELNEVRLSKNTDLEIRAKK